MSYDQLSMSESRISPITAVDVWPCSSARAVSQSMPYEWISEKYELKVASITLISVAVVSSPVNAHQSLTTNPAPITSDPRLTVPAYEKPIRDDFPEETQEHTYDQGDLEQAAELVLILYARLRMDEGTLVREGAV